MFTALGGGVNFLAQAVEPQPLFAAPMQLLANFGFFRVVLPFLLIFALIYGVIIKTKVLGEEKMAKGVAAIIAMSVAFFVIIYTPVVNALAVLIPQASFLLVVVLMLLMMLAMIFPQFFDYFKEKPSWILGVIALVFIVIFLGITGYAVGDSVPWLNTFSKLLMGAIPLELTPETINLLIGFGIILGIPIIILAIVMWPKGKD